MLLPPAPSQFSSAAVAVDQSLQFTLTGEPGATYLIQTSTNLVDWETLSTLVLTNGSTLFNAGAVTNDAQRYFRAQLGP